MSEMVGQVARSLFCANSTNAHPERTWAEICNMPQHVSTFNFYQNQARTAIAAMRTPTDAMLDYRDAGVKKHDALLVWQHQIDEALK